MLVVHVILNRHDVAYHSVFIFFQRAYHRLPPRPLVQANLHLVFAHCQNVLDGFSEVYVTCHVSHASAFAD